MKNKVNSRPYIVFQADSFCFGPASIALAIGKQIKEKTGNSYFKLIALGQGTSYELFSSSSVFDECYVFEYSCLDEIPNSMKDILLQSFIIMSVADFHFAKLVSSLGLKVIFIDPLFWMWDKVPIRIDTCAQYYAVDFPGVSEKIDEFALHFPDDKKPIIVNAIRDNSSLASVASAHSNMLLINLGGMQCPFGYNLELILSMCRCILEVTLEEKLYDKILICGGGEPIKYLAEQFRDYGRKVEVESLPQRKFFVQVASCRTLMTVPGLSIVYEALYFSKPTLFLLPLNYSQHLQSAIYRKILKNYCFVSWGKMPGYQELPPNLLEENGIRLSFQQGKKFSSDPHAQLIFKNTISDFFQKVSSLGHALGIRLDETKGIRFDGASQIADKILADMFV